jgi:thiamine pyrophosphate-dependent acetolactate synthase large subunit-like protein
MMTEPVTTPDLLTRLADLRNEDDVVIATMTAGILWPQHTKHEMDLWMMAPMGAASPMGLGIAMARPDLGVIVLDSDGAILMSLGSLVTIGGKRPARFLHIILENEAYDITGGQPLPGNGTQSLPEFAESLGYARGLRSAQSADLEKAVQDVHDGLGPILLAVPVTRGDFQFAHMTEWATSEKAMLRTGGPGYAHLRDHIAAHPVKT